MQTQKERRIIYKTCSFCGERFPCVRIDAKFCCSSHKAKYFRWRQKLPAMVDKARAQIREMATYLDYDISRPTAVEFFNSLIAETRAAIGEKGLFEISG